jgi:hypothetical protein
VAEGLSIGKHNLNFLTLHDISDGIEAFEDHG